MLSQAGTLEMLILTLGTLPVTIVSFHHVGINHLYYNCNVLCFLDLCFCKAFFVGQVTAQRLHWYCIITCLDSTCCTTWHFWIALKLQWRHSHPPVSDFLILYSTSRDWITCLFSSRHMFSRFMFSKGILRRADGITEGTLILDSNMVALYVLLHITFNFWLIFTVIALPWSKLCHCKVWSCTWKIFTSVLSWLVLGKGILRGANSIAKRALVLDSHMVTLNVLLNICIIKGLVFTISTLPGSIHWLWHAQMGSWIQNQFTSYVLCPMISIDVHSEGISSRAFLETVGTGVANRNMLRLNMLQQVPLILVLVITW